jgi:hypothetical protein
MDARRKCPAGCDLTPIGSPIVLDCAKQAEWVQGRDGAGYPEIYWVCEGVQVFDCTEPDTCPPPPPGRNPGTDTDAARRISILRRKADDQQRRARDIDAERERLKDEGDAADFTITVIKVTRVAVIVLAVAGAVAAVFVPGGQGIAAGNLGTKALLGKAAAQRLILGGAPRLARVAP